MHRAKKLKLWNSIFIIIIFYLLFKWEGWLDQGPKSKKSQGSNWKFWKKMLIF